MQVIYVLAEAIAQVEAFLGLWTPQNPPGQGEIQRIRRQMKQALEVFHTARQLDRSQERLDEINSLLSTVTKETPPEEIQKLQAERRQINKELLKNIPRRAPEERVTLEERAGRMQRRLAQEESMGDGTEDSDALPLEGIDVTSR